MAVGPRSSRHFDEGSSSVLDDVTMAWGDLALEIVPEYQPWRVECMAVDRAPARQLHDCCWYHSVDWVAASAVARRLTCEAALECDVSLPARVVAALPRELSPLVAEGVQSLLYWPIDATPVQITNGGHRITAMRGQGVEVTLGVRFAFEGTDWATVPGVYPGQGARND